MKAIINHQESNHQRQIELSSWTSVFPQPSTDTFDWYRIPLSHRRSTDPDSQLPYPNTRFGSCGCGTKSSVPAAGRQALARRWPEQMPVLGHECLETTARGGPQAEGPHEAPLAAQMRHLLFNNALEPPSHQVFLTWGHQHSKPL